jgi:transposase-like protein
LWIADGALGFWAALRDVYPEAEEQHCWVDKIANVLDKLPKRIQPRAKSQLHEIMRAEGRWRRVNSPHLVALVAVGTRFPDGKTHILPGLLSDSVVNQQLDAAAEPVIHNT